LRYAVLDCTTLVSGTIDEIVSNAWVSDRMGQRPDGSDQRAAEPA
jgi:hypothetical protein